MARANRHFISGNIWHLTHRCRKREFLLKFSRDRNSWIEPLRACKSKWFKGPNQPSNILSSPRTLLRPSAHGKKRLNLGECKLLRAHLQNIPLSITVIDDHPAVAALGYAAHSLMTMRPWLVFTQPE